MNEYLIVISLIGLVAALHAHIRDKRLAALGFDQQPIGSVLTEDGGA